MTDEDTFHPDTRALLSYGRALAGGDAPAEKGRADHVLDRLFVIERMQDGRWPVRTFGAELVDLFGRDLRDADFAQLWLAPDKALLEALLDASDLAGEPAIIRVIAETAGPARLAAEILFTPLRIEPDFGERFLALFQPLGGEAFTRGQVVTRLRAGSLHPPHAKAKASLRLVAANV
ncbi:MAG: PAS domain-containing protein [Alphaproteobacteria bacterium]|nr:PAS domain-containing protein [Alphaproteobacteria bacterium]